MSKPCAECRREYLARIQKKTGGQKNVFIDLSRFVAKCEIPTFTHDVYGNPIVVVWDCENKKEVVLSNKEYLRLRQLGEQ